jgi:uncharacterized protein
VLIQWPDLRIKVLKNALIPMSDGVHVAADIYAPDDFDFDSPATKLPAVMEHIPYRKDDVGKPNARSWYAVLPRYGYLFARVDCRGTGASEGSTSDEYSVREQQDGAEAVEWLAAQPWCNDRVAMMGISYGGFTALQVAALAPPHLSAIVPIDFTDDRYADDCHYVSGLLRMYHDVGYYGTFMVAFNAMPPDAAAAETDWADVWTKHLEENEPYLLTWLRHQVRSEYWENGSVGHSAELIECPVFMIGGWHDGYTNPPLRLYEALKVPRKMLIGPWDHAVPDHGIPGPRIDYLPHVARWLDQWCKDGDEEADPDPPVTVFMEQYSPADPDMVEAPGEWRSEVDWPPPGSRKKTLFVGSGLLTEIAPDNAGADELAYDPSVGVTTGLFSAGIPLNLPTDHRRDETFSVNYTSDELTDDIHIIGRPVATVQVASTARTSAIAVTLCEVGPDGHSRMVSKGITKVESQVPSGGGFSPVQEIDVQLNAVAWRFSRGNRIRVSIANADFPNVWPTAEPARTRIFSSASTASSICLPVVSPKPSAPTPSFKDSAAVVTATSRTPIRVWEVTDDLISNATRVLCRFTNLNGAFNFVAEVNRDTPSDAKVAGSFLMSKNIAGRLIEADAHAVISSTAAAFHATISLVVSIDGVAAVTRRWVESFARAS